MSSMLRTCKCWPVTIFQTSPEDMNSAYIQRERINKNYRIFQKFLRKDSHVPIEIFRSLPGCAFVDFQIQDKHISNFACQLCKDNDIQKLSSSCERTEPQFYKELYFTQYNTSCLQKNILSLQHPNLNPSHPKTCYSLIHNRNTMPKSPRTNKVVAT